MIRVARLRALGLGSIALLLLPAVAEGSRLPAALGRPDSCRGLRVSFRRGTVDDPRGAEHGTFSLGSGGEWRVDYAEPVEQITISKPGLTVFLYPKERRAIRLWTGELEAPVWAIFAAQALFSTEEMTAQGFEIVGFEARGDTSVSSMRWPRSRSAEARGLLRVFRMSGVVVRLDVLNGGDITRQVLVDSIGTSGGIRVPAIVRFIELGPEGTSEHRVEYSGFQPLTALGARFDPAIPAGYTVEERRW